MSSRISLLFLSIAILANAQQSLPEGPAKETYERVCGTCHPADMVMGRGHTLEEWGRVVGEMAAAGAQGSDEELSAIVEYLAKNFPPSAASNKVNVNRAGPKELSSRLEISMKEAAAVVKYRDASGPYKTVEDLKNVPGLDFKKIETKKDRISF